MCCEMGGAIYELLISDSQMSTRTESVSQAERRVDWLGMLAFRHKLDAEEGQAACYYLWSFFFLLPLHFHHIAVGPVGDLLAN